MITLPIVTSGTKVTAAAGSADAGTENTLGLAQAADGAAGEDPKGFITLLGNKLLTLAQQNAGGKAVTGKAAAVAAETAQTEAEQSPKAKLNALLAALDKPEHLTAMLQPAKSTDELKTTEGDKAEDLPLALNTGDMQALQALYAMLPPTGVQQPALNASKADEALLKSEDVIKSGKNSTLASLLTTDTGKEEQSAKATEGNNGKLSSPATLSTAAQQSKNPADASLTATFQQALSHAGKEGDKENSSSVAPATITNTVVSAASAALTPATTSMVTAPPPAQLSSQLGSHEWQQALGQQILMFSKNGQQTAELHLHPQDLGSIQISLKLDADQASLSMVSNHSQVRAALEAALPQLRTALAENGISLGQSNVSSDAFQQGQGSNGQQGQQRNDRGNTFSLASENNSDAVPLAVPAALQARAAGSSAVDIFA
ncbi:flagellar hook-length control protein FliK [Erwinia sp. E_sp_B01_3]|uniref:flagellar hook-length control protein FliK n=1 Tax=unclassified Erwinia TaxID=2622719 RepID=UPI0030CEA9C4